MRYIHPDPQPPGVSVIRGTLPPAIGFYKSGHHFFTRRSTGIQSPVAGPKQSHPFVAALHLLIANHLEQQREFSELMVQRQECRVLHNMQQQILESLAEYVMQQYGTATCFPPVTSEQPPTDRATNEAPCEGISSADYFLPVRFTPPSTTVHNSEGEEPDTAANRDTNEKLAVSISIVYKQHSYTSGSFDDTVGKTILIKFAPPQIKPPIHLLDRDG